jgi:uncharacterized protein (DUF1697 family)
LLEDKLMITQYLALLRGINVGGKNIIKMADLKACFEANRFGNVATYIQSGNVLFTAPETDPSSLAGKIEAALSSTFPAYKARIMLRSYEELNQIARSAPQGFGSQPKEYRYDVLYLRAPLTAPQVLEGLSIKPGVDEVFAGPGVLYFSRLIAKASQSHLTRIVSLPIYQEMTIRNWNTTCKLLALMDARAQE